MTRTVITSTIRFVGWGFVVIALATLVSKLVPGSENNLPVGSNLIALAVGAAILVFCPKK